MSSVIVSIDKGSPASKSILKTGDTVLSVNGNKIIDVLDYKYYTYEPVLEIGAKSPDGKYKVTLIKKEEGQDPGINFDHYLMDGMRRCANKCVFCFIDQLPKGMRDTLYFKDDDARMSFLLGNYISLTNLSQREVERIIQLKISPINVSVQTTNPELRSLMLGNKRAGKCLEIMDQFAKGGIVMNCQIVCCPGLNDGEELMRSMRDLAALFPAVKSVSIVPVGLTKHREGLFKLTPFDKSKAQEVIDMTDAFGDECLKKFGTRLFFCADELYIKAERPLPEEEYYEDYTQLENGVGMMRLLMTEFTSALAVADEAKYQPFSMVTGAAAAPFIQELYLKAKEKFPGIDGKIYEIKNDFFGHSITVAGLITGQDIIKQLKGKKLPEKMYIPQNMLRHEEGVFLDDTTPEDIERELGVKITPIPQDGGDLLDAMLGVYNGR